MAIIYYPDHIQKKAVHAVNRPAGKASFFSAGDHHDLSGDALAFVQSSPGSWQIEGILLHFSDAATSRTYSVSSMSGRGIVGGLNDTAYFKMDGAATQLIVLSEGFYNGDDLATELKTQLDANTEFQNLSAIPFAVSYDSGTGLFTVAPDSGNIKFVSINTTVPVRRNSTAGPVLGFTSDSASAASISSDTSVPSLGAKTVILSGAAVTTQDIVSTDKFAMTVDQALAIDVDAASLEVDYSVTYSLVE